MTDQASKKDQAGQLLSAEEILQGGDDPYQPLEMPELPKGGRPGVVYLKPLPAGDVLDFVDQAEGKNRNQALLELIAKAVVTPKGEPLFTKEQAAQLRNISIKAFNRLATAVTAMADIDEGGPEGNE